MHVWRSNGGKYLKTMLTREKTQQEGEEKKKEGLCEVTYHYHYLGNGNGGEPRTSPL